MILSSPRSLHLLYSVARILLSVLGVRASFRCVFVLGRGWFCTGGNFGGKKIVSGSRGSPAAVNGHVLHPTPQPHQTLDREGEIM